jgi:flagellar biosynthesis/type III secretory pathway protein FliH
MTGKCLVLERFDDGAGALGHPDEVRAQQQRAAAYAEGFAAGEAAALTRAAEGNSELQHAAEMLTKHLDDFDREAAVCLCKALEAAAGKILPVLAEKGFAHDAAGTLVDAVQKNGDAALVLKTAPEKDEFLKKAMAEVGLQERINVEPDASLSGTQLAVTWECGGLAFDTDRAISLFLASLEKTIQDMTIGEDND